jgi:hypothetical protein
VADQPLTAARPGGNIAVYFEVLSYTGTLTITATTDPDHFPHLATLTGALQTELDLITDAPRPRPPS